MTLASLESVRPGPRASRGFTLLELVVAFAILSIVIVNCVAIQASSVDTGAKAIDIGNLRVMADTVFRKIVYEHWKWQDGMHGTADEWYADFVGIRDTAKRDRWRIYRLELHKKKGMVAGTDPSGRIEALFEGGDDGSSTTTSTSSSSTSGSTSGTGTGTGTEEPTAGEPAYQIELDVFLLDAEEPELRLRSVIPVPDSEREDESK
jgi:prepilin-type N-terminal cleavage/methylation domain-containing protein